MSTQREKGKRWVILTQEDERRRESIIRVGESALTQKEKQGGTLLIRIRKRNTDFSFFKDGKAKYSSTILAGNKNFILDFAIHEGISTLEQAEKVLRRKILNEEENSLLEKVLGPRANEIFRLISANIEISFPPHIHGEINSLVITGMNPFWPGIKNEAEKIFKKPVRVVIPRPNEYKN